MNAKPMNGMNISRRRLQSALATAGLAMLLAALSPSHVAAAVSSDEAARIVSEQYSVQVLRVRAAVLDDTPVWLVTFMNPGGNSNDAFRVTTLAVDQESGELVPAFRHGANGFSLPEGQEHGTRLELRPEAMRSGVWR